MLGRVASSQVLPTGRRSWEVRIADDTGMLTLRFFHHTHYQVRSVSPGDWMRCFGMVRPGLKGMEMIHPEYRVSRGESPPPPDETDAPIYPSTAGLSQKKISALVLQVLSTFDGKNLPGPKSLRPGFLSGNGGLLGKAVCNSWTLGTLGTLGFALFLALAWLLLSLSLFGANILAFARFLARHLSVLARFFAFVGTFLLKLRSLIRPRSRQTKSDEAEREPALKNKDRVKARPVEKKEKKRPPTRAVARQRATPLKKGNYTFPHLQLLDQQPLDRQVRKTTKRGRSSSWRPSISLASK